MADMNVGSLIFSSDLANSIPAAAPKRKTQMRRWRCIFCAVELSAPHGEEARER